MPQQPIVLVVEDQLGPRESLRAILQPDYRVLMAVEGEHALHLVEHEPVDVVLLDLRLPGLSGLHILAKIKAINPAIEVIVVTGFDPDGRVPAELGLLIFAYIVKPFHVSHVRETVKRAVAHHAQEREGMSEIRQCSFPEQQEEKNAAQAAQSQNPPRHRHAV